jgi:hypothetical protein
MTSTLLDTEIWIGRAFCTVAAEKPKPSSKTNGALLNFACTAEDVATAVRLIVSECQDNEMVVQGFEYLMCKAYMDREPSEYEIELIGKLKDYPVQFRDVFVFGPDA